MKLLSQLLKFFHTLLGFSAALNQSPRDVKIIVSLTTIGFRIRKVHKVMLIILNQSIKADKIILYVDKENFSFESLPFILKIYQLAYGVEFRFVEDIGPHTKYFHAMKEFPNDIVLTVDDDVKYPVDLIAELFESYKRYPKAVSARRGHFITFDENNQIKKYTEWHHKYDKIIDKPSLRLFATGVGGVLYPPKIICEEGFNLEKLKRLSLKNDDIWLKFMQLLTSTPVVFTPPFRTKHIKGSQKVALNKGNVAGGGNDVIVQNLAKEYDVLNKVIQEQSEIK